MRKCQLIGDAMGQIIDDNRANRSAGTADELSPLKGGYERIEPTSCAGRFAGCSDSALSS